MRSPTVFQMFWNTGVEPVKCTPARSRWARRVSLIGPGSPGMKLMTPGGRPASSRIFMM
jgi:hypothetical protein